MKWVVNEDGEATVVASSESLKKYYNLGDIVSEKDAISNLGLHEKLISKEDLVSANFHAYTIKETKKKKFIEEDQINSFNNKMSDFTISENPLVSTHQSDLYYNTAVKRVYLKYNNEYYPLSPQSKKVISGKDTFLGRNEEKRIPHPLKSRPDFVDIEAINSNTRTGDIWVKYDENFIYVGNSGDANGEFAYTVYPKKSN